ncbi:MAG: GMC family oxidoreductase N-terminal domain-containing protein [Gemmatimonadales bacterium]
MTLQDPSAPPGKAEQALTLILRVLAGVFLAAIPLYALGPLLHVGWLPLDRDFFRQLPFVSNSVVKVAILLACCLYAAGDLRRRFGLVWIVLAAHAVSVVAMLLLLATVDTGYLVHPGLGAPQPVGRVLWGAIALDGVILLVLGAFAIAARGQLRRTAAWTQPDERWLTPQEQWLRTLLYVLGGVFALAAVGYELGPISGIGPEFFRELPFVTNSVVKISVLAMVCLYVAHRPRRHLSLVGPVIAVHLLSALVQILYLVVKPPALDTTAVLAGRTLTMAQVLSGAVLLDAALGGLLLVMYLAAWRARLGAQFFRPIEFRTLIALADIMLVGPEERVTPEETAANVDRALARMRTERKGTFRIALAAIHYWPLLSLQPPLPELSPWARTEFVRARFYREPGKRSTLRFLKPFLQAFMRVGHQLTNLGYYNDPRAHEDIEFSPFSKRARLSGLHLPPRAPHPLKVMRPGDLDSDTLTTDVCIIGSGAGGGILAYSLAERGREVLVLERGAYVEPRFFVEDELQQLGSLYDGGMIQLSEDYRFTVLQGNCVGGSTTVNNGICFDPPAEVLARWNQPGGQDAALDLGDLAASTEWVKTFLRVHRLDGQAHQAAALIRPLLERDGSRWGLAPPQPFDANIAHDANLPHTADTADIDRACFGCGYCNDGCAFGKKFSMLDTALPWGQARFGAGRLRILAECEVERVRTASGRPARALGVRARLSDGRQVTIKAEQVILAAGAIGSSYLLLKSGIGRGLPVGKGLAFNMMTPVFAEFAQPLNSYDGVQMGHYVKHEANEFIIETWFSPPVGLATAMPGWFGDHYQNMRRAGHMVAFGMVVGTESNAQVTQPLTGGPGFKYDPRAGDLRRLGHGLRTLAEVLLEAGARRVMLNTWDNCTYTDRASLDRIERAASDPSTITLASAHPQGGNALGRSRRRGVVDERFRVHGFENLYVCDASVFPGSLQVNPQLTVMSLARYAAGRIA